MRIISIVLVSLLLTNCTNSYVKNKKSINSPNDLMKFTNIWARSTYRIFFSNGRNFKSNEIWIESKRKGIVWLELSLFFFF